jgi:hypothetical protein
LVFAVAAVAQTTPVASQYGGYSHRGRFGATFYVKDDFSGRSVSVDRPVRSFREFDMDDKVSSIQIDGRPWLVCENDNFHGRCQVIDHSIGRLDGLGMDDMISAARPVDRGDNQGGWGRGRDNGNWDRNGGPSYGNRPSGNSGPLQVDRARKVAAGRRCPAAPCGPSAK